MTRVLTTTALVALWAGAAQAGGLDRSGQPIGIIFQEGNYAQFSYSRTNPDLTGTDANSGLDIDETGDGFSNFGVGLKFDLNEQLSFSLIFDQPFGSDINYPTSLSLGGTSAIADTESLTGILRYKIDENFSVHGGIRVQNAGGNVDLRGLGYQGLDGYSVRLETDTAVGYVVGGAYERPDIALRIAVTYSSAITHEFNTTETLNGAPLAAERSITESDTPQSINLDFQTGIAPGTLLFGSVRWAEWGEFKIEPEVFTPLANGGLVDLDDSLTYTLGLGRQFTDQFAGSVAFTYEKTDSDDLVSPLAPTNGLFAISLGGRYTTQNNVEIGVGARYSWIGNARPETGPDIVQAEFEDNTALSLGMSIGFAF